MNSHIVVVKIRDYRLNELQMEHVALEWEGYPVQMSGGIDDMHFEFMKAQNAEGFKRGLLPFKI